MSSSAKPAKRKGRVFISYRRPDAALARELEQCGSSGLELYSFPYGHDADGQDWRIIVRDLIRSADALVCIVGRSTAESENVVWEMREAQARHVPVFLAGPGAASLAESQDHASLLDGETSAQIIDELRRAL